MPDTETDELAALRDFPHSEHGAMHASAPPGWGCADCQMEREPCPICYAAWWKKKHPNVVQVGGPFETAPPPQTDARELPEAKRYSIRIDDGRASFNESLSGMWVYATDYDALRARCVELQAEAATAKECESHFNSLRIDAELRAESAEAARAASERDARRWQYWRSAHSTTLLVTLYGNGCINCTIEDAEKDTDIAIAMCDGLTAGNGKGVV